MNQELGGDVRGDGEDAPSERAGEKKSSSARRAAPAGGMTRVDAAVVVILALGSAYLTSAALKAPPQIGQWQDDGIYLTTSKSLAEGHGYRRPELPGEPWQTKYPVLYPLLLSAVWRFRPDFPANVAVIRILHGVLTFLGLTFCHLALRRTWRMSDLTAGAASVAAVVSAGWMGVTKTPMSEALFLPLMGLALWMAAPTADDAADGRKQRTAWGRALLGGLAAAAAYLTRTIGVALIASLVISWLWQRRWREAAVCAVLGAAAITGWRAWAASAEAANAANPVRQALGYELNYGLWAPRDIATAARVSSQNTAAIAYAIYDSLLQPPLDGTDEKRLRGEISAIPIYAPMIATTALFLLGAAFVFSSRVPAIHVFLALYLLLTAVWPFPPNRFVLVIYPFITAGIAAGLFVPIAGVARLFEEAPESRPGLLAALRRDGIAGLCATESASSRIASGVVLVFAAVLVLHHYTLLRAIAASDRSDESRDWNSLAQLIREKTPPDAVIAGGHGGYMHLLTGRKFVLILPMDDPARLLYSEYRKYRHCGNSATPEEVEHFRKWVHERLREYHAAVGATFALFSKDMQLFSALFRGEAQANRSYWPFVADHAMVTLHRFVP